MSKTCSKPVNLFPDPGEQRDESDKHRNVQGGDSRVHRLHLSRHCKTIFTFLILKVLNFTILNYSKVLIPKNHCYF